MQFDFSKVPLKNRAFSEKPMTFIDQEAKNFLAAIIDVVAIETEIVPRVSIGSTSNSKIFWQFAAQKSAFWRERIGTRKITDVSPSDLPVLTRSDVAKQVELEGSLLPANGSILQKNSQHPALQERPCNFSCRR